MNAAVVAPTTDRVYRQVRWQSLGVSCRSCTKSSALETGYWCKERQLCNRCYRGQLNEVKKINNERTKHKADVTRDMPAPPSQAPPPEPEHMLAEVRASVCLTCAVGVQVLTG